MGWGDIVDVFKDVGDIAEGAGSVLGLFGGNDRTSDRMASNFAFQREMAQHGVRWRVEDAKAAGIHPLFALGANLPAGSPVQVFESEDNFGDRLARAGQGLSRAMDATRTSGERVSARLDALMLERSELQNELLRSQIARLNQQRNPAMPSVGPNLEMLPGQGDVPIYESKPLEVTIPHVSMPHSEPSAITDVGWAKTATGGVVPVPSKDVKERIEDNFIPETMWAVRNLLIPNLPFVRPRTPPRDMLPSGADHWEWSRLRQEFVPMWRRSPVTGEREYRYDLKDIERR